MEDDPSWPTAQDFSLPQINTLEVQNAGSFAELQSIFFREAANEIGAVAKAFEVLSNVCAYVLRPSASEHYGPRFMWKERRTEIPNDLGIAKTEVLGSIAPAVDLPILSARLSDVAWHNDRRRFVSARKAIEGYCSHILGTASNPHSEWHQGYYLVSLIERAFYIFRSLGKNSELPDILVRAYEYLYDRFHKETQPVNFVRTASLDKHHDIYPIEKLIKDCESVATDIEGSTYPEANKAAWYFASALYTKLKDKPNSRNCLGNVAKETLKLRDRAGSFMSKAALTQSAISEYRSAGGFFKEIEALRAQLSEFQAQSMAELGVHEIPMNLTSLRNLAIEEADERSITDALAIVAFYSSIPTRASLIENASSSLSQNSFAHFFASTRYVDAEGRTVAVTDKSELGEIIPKILRDLDAFYHIQTEGETRPQLVSVMKQYSITESHFRTIAANSQFIPSSHAPIFCLGFARFFQGDFLSAAHLLIPQVENSIRHLLSNSGIDSSSMNKHGVQEDRSLSGLFSEMRSEVDSIIGEDLAFSIEMLFITRGGPNLRHKAAHGKLSTSEALDPSCIYACWLIYRMAMMPLSSIWAQHIAPQIESEHS